MALEIREIMLPKGASLKVSMTPEFKSRVRKHFNLNEDDNISDEYVRMFFYGAVKNAVEEAEREKG